MLEKLNQSLLVDLKKILENTTFFGLASDEKGRLSLSHLGETVVTIEKWKWITRYDLEDALYLTPDYIIKDGMISGKQKNIFPPLPAYSPLKSFSQPLYLGTSKMSAEKILSEGSGKKEVGLRLVSTPELAGLISIYHTGFNGSTPDMQSTILKVNPAVVFADGARILETPSLFFTGEFLKPGHFSEFKAQDQILLQLRWEIRVNETLYMEYPNQSRIAAEDLFRLKTQVQVEDILTEYLSSDIPQVRRNVAQALGLPCYQQGFFMDAPRPSQKSLLEAVSVQPETLKKMLNAVKREVDVEAAHWFLCSLSAQYYGGKLLDYAGEVYDLANIIEAHFGNKKK